eukprot:COSAG02_NODE_7195_length_3126_cov_1.920714_1_plen_47_part_10
MRAPQLVALCLLLLTLPSHWRCASTSAVRPLAAAAGRGQHPPDARDQ